MTTEYDNKDGLDWAYIDHGSSASEGENTEIFDNDEQLKSFIFNPDSYIQNQNDNE
jgi:hypothetical protein